MHSAGSLVDLVVAAEILQQGIDTGLEMVALGQFDFIQILHEIAENRTLATAAGYRFAGGFLLQILNAVKGGDSG